MARSVYYGPFMPKQRQIAVDNDRRWLANNPYAFSDYDDVAAHLRRRTFNRMHTIVREQAYLKQYPAHRSPWLSRPQGGANWKFTPRWDRTRQPGYRGRDRVRKGKLYVGHPQDGAYRRIRYSFKRR
jgi:hypothetical protein